MLEAYFLKWMNQQYIQYQACGPDIVCIVESWLCADNADVEVSLPNYSTIRLDRNRHGGGILVFVKNNLSFEVLMSGPAGLELYFCLMP